MSTPYDPKADDLLSAPRRTVWTVESPDGFAIEQEPQHYPTQEAARAALALWVERYRAQGYYSTARMQRIGFSFIASCCMVSEVDAAEYADEDEDEERALNAQEEADELREARLNAAL